MFNVPLRRVHETIVAVETNKCYILVSVFSYPQVCNAHAPHCCL
jgi:hypothetical protein